MLGAMLVSEGAVARVTEDVGLVAEDFYLDRHRLIFEAVAEHHRLSAPIDELTVAERLIEGGRIEPAGGRNHVPRLAASVPAVGNPGHFVEIVQQNSLLRRLLGETQEIQEWIGDRVAQPRELADRAEQLLFEVAHKERTGDFEALGDILHREVDRLEALSTGDAEVTGAPSGFRDIDSLTGGFQPGNPIIVAARPSMGE